MFDLYQVLTLQHDDPLAVWGLPKRQAIELLPGNSPLRRAIEAFDRALRACYRSEEPVEQALAVIEAGVAFLQTARRWWEEHASSAGPG